MVGFYNRDLAQSARDTTSRTAVLKSRTVMARTGASFSVGEHMALSKRILARQRAGDPDASTAYAIFSRTVGKQQPGFVAVHPDTPAKAALLAKVLRSRGVDGFVQGLERLEEIAGQAQTEGRAFRLSHDDFFSALALVETDEDDSPEHAEASRLFRAVAIRAGTLQLHLTVPQAMALGDTMRATRAARGLIASIDMIAGRVPTTAA